MPTSILFTANVRVGKSELVRARRRRAPAATLTFLTDSAQVGPSIVAALVNSTPNVHSGAARRAPGDFGASIRHRPRHCNPHVSGILVDHGAQAQVNVRRGFSH
jgi:hypothetical protein